MKKNALNLAVAIALSGMVASANATIVSLNFSGVVAWANSSTTGINYSDSAVGTTATGFMNFDTDFFDTTNASGNLYGHTTTSGQRIYYGPLSVSGMSQPSILPFSAGATVGSNSLLTVRNDYFSSFYGSITRSNPSYSGNDAGIRIDWAYGQRFNGMEGSDFQYVWLFTYDETASTSIFDFNSFLSNPTINWNAPGATTGANIRFSENLQYHLTDVRVTMSAPITPVPEPETYSMMLIGIGMLALMAERRKNT